MPISDIPMFSMLRTKLQWHQERQRVLAGNVANANTPNFRPRDLVPPDFNRTVPLPSSIGLARTDPAHLVGTGGDGSFGRGRQGGYEIRPTGNAVTLEDQMMSIASNQMDYSAVATLYSRGLGLIKTALGKG
ncbi:MAG TPA: flagellar basal body rod protein FlgB [Xanthobacteraceae bacterium]|nr:flagellar basal body rod protein FlgB [Xanthobacteraceae bacterium]